MGNFISNAWEGVKDFFKGPKVPNVPQKSTEGFSPEYMKLAEDQLTRGMTSKLLQDQNGIKDFFAGRGLLHSTAAMGEMAKMGANYFNSYQDSMGKLHMANLEQRQGNADYNAQAQYQDALNKRQRWQDTWNTVGQVAGMFA
jgi:hypothetical protein